MCHDHSAQPPYPPGAPGSAHSEDIVLTAADGTRFSAFAAHPEQPAGAQVAIFGDARGLGRFYKELAMRFATVGYPAVAMDHYGRTAGTAARAASFAF